MAEQNFERMLAEVEDIVTALKSGELELDQVVSKVERAFAILKKLKTRLQKAELKITNIKDQVE